MVKNRDIVHYQLSTIDVERIFKKKKKNSFHYLLITQ